MVWFEVQGLIVEADEAVSIESSKQRMEGSRFTPDLSFGDRLPVKFREDQVPRHPGPLSRKHVISLTPSLLPHVSYKISRFIQSIVH